MRRARAARPREQAAAVAGSRLGGLRARGWARRPRRRRDAALEHGLRATCRGSGTRARETRAAGWGLCRCARVAHGNSKKGVGNSETATSLRMTARRKEVSSSAPYPICSARPPSTALPSRPTSPAADRPTGESRRPVAALFGPAQRGHRGGLLVRAGRPLVARLATWKIG